jgi:surface antigen
MQKRARTVVGAVAAALALSFSGASGAQAKDYWQCAYFARLFSGIEIFGDAWTWWSKAAGKYARGNTPREGAVLAFKPTGSMRLGHVSVVSNVLTDRVIQVTHANWSRIGGTRGQIEKDVTVVDVSPRGDWTMVKVWYDPLKDLGTTAYPTHGFIYRSRVDEGSRMAAMTVARAAVGQVSQAAQPTAGSPMDAIVRMGAQTSDRLGDLLNAATGQPSGQ